MASSSRHGYALVVGAGSGIGQETAFMLSERGARGVMFADINLEATQQAAKTSQAFATNGEYRSIAKYVDVTKQDSVRQLVSATMDEFGHIDCFINSAGIDPESDKLIADVDLDEFDRLHNVNVKGMLICTGIVSTAMAKQDERFVEGRNGRRSIGRGAIVNLASLASYTQLPTKVQYVASKYGALGVSQTAALELFKSRVRVNAVCPGWVDTPMMERSVARTPAMAEYMKERLPLGRMANAEEIAGTVCFLCSPDASYVNGAGWIVDSGMSLGV